jgi:hypothetical protein
LPARNGGERRDMVAEISALLDDIGERYGASGSRETRYLTWDAMAQRQLALYRQLAPRADRLQ